MLTVLIWELYLLQYLTSNCSRAAFIFLDCVRCPHFFTWLCLAPNIFLSVYEYWILLSLVELLRHDLLKSTLCNFCFNASLTTASEKWRYLGLICIDRWLFLAEKIGTMCNSEAWNENESIAYFPFKSIRTLKSKGDPILQISRDL